MINKLGGVGSAEQLRLTALDRDKRNLSINSQDSFSSVFKGALDKVSQSQQQASELGKQFQLGNPNVSLEETMIASQTASLGFQSLVAVRNQMVKAYSEIMNMQV